MIEENLMDKILEPENLNKAYKKVKANKGAPGVDEMTVDELKVHIKENKETG